jgi:hypothetical protein
VIRIKILADTSHKLCVQSPNCAHLEFLDITTQQTPTKPTVSQVVKMSNAELASAYAALILADDGIEITV